MRPIILIKNLFRVYRRCGEARRKYIQIALAQVYWKTIVHNLFLTNHARAYAKDASHLCRRNCVQQTIQLDIVLCFWGQQCLRPNTPRPVGK